MLKKLVLVLAAINVLLMLTTAAFIHLWASLADRGELARSLIQHGLVQFHLATENVLAAWYSSMMLLAVAVLCVAAWVIDRQQGGDRMRFSAGWLVLAAAFALLSIDEIGSLHERVGMLVKDTATGRAVGWVYALSIPIAIVGIFMLAFAWLHLRRTPGVLVLMAAGTALFVSNPVLEQIEMSIIHGASAAQGTWQRMAHDGLLVFEEGVNELFGTLCFLTAAALYLRHGLNDVTITALTRVRHLGSSSAIGFGVACATGALVAPEMIGRLPAADTGILANWFPAAALFALASLVMARRATDGTQFAGRAPLWLAATALALSAWFGAGLHGYTTWYRFEVLRELSRSALLVSLVASSSIIATRIGWSWTIVGGLSLIAAAVNVTSAYAASLASLGAALCVAGMSVTKPAESGRTQPTAVGRHA